MSDLDKEVASTDRDIQREIINKLCEYGDSLLDDEERLEDERQKRATSHKVATESKVKKNLNVKRKKKKKKCADETHNNDTPSKNTKNNSLRQFEDELRMFQSLQNSKVKEQFDHRKDGALIETGKRKRNQPEVIVFQDPSRRKKQKLEGTGPESGLRIGPGSGPRTGQGSDKTDSTLNPSQEMDLDKVRHDVWKFSLAGFSFEDKEKREAAKAVQLGAKAPRKEYVNYKELMEIKKQQRVDEQKQREIDRQMGLKTSKKKHEKIHVKNTGFWTDKTQKKKMYIDGQIGKFKRGVQVISKRDITKIKMQKRGGHKK